MSTTVESLELKISSDSTQAAKGIEALTQSLAKLKSATKGDLGLSSVTKKINNIGTSSQKASLSFASVVSKVKAVAKTFKIVGKTITSLIDKSSEYNEVVNLFSVSMGQYAEAAYTYANKVSDIMGIDPSEWMKSQGVFMTLATGFGIAGDRASTMSEQLTQLGYDISSFQNISVEEAMQKLQSGLAGELEPLRRIGYDLSQAKLESVAEELGIDKAVADMTQAEKAQLRYYAIMTQVTQQQGDMARTLEDPANQMRIFKAQLEVTARSIGNIFIPALKAILPYAIAVTKVIGEMANSLATALGYEMPEVKSSATDSMSNAATTTATAMEESTESAKKLKSAMLGIDELNVISPDTKDTMDDLTSTGFDFALPTYDFLGGANNSKVEGIVKKIKGALESFKKVFDSFKISPALESLGDLFTTLKGQFDEIDLKTPILSTVEEIFTAISSVLNLIIPILADVIEKLNIPQLVSDRLTLISELWKTINDVIDALSPAITTFYDSLSPVIEWIGGAASDVLTLFKDVLEKIGNLFEVNAPTFTSIGESLGEIVDVIWKLIEPLLSTVWDETIKFIKKVFDAISPVITKLLELVDVILKDLSDAFTGLGEILTPFAEFIETVLSDVFSEILSPALDKLCSEILPTLIKVFKDLWENVLVPLGELIGSVLTPVVETLSDALTLLWENVVIPLSDALQGVFGDAFDGIATILKDTVIPIVEKVIEVLQFLWDKVFEPMVKIVKDVWGPAFEEVFKGIGGIIEGLQQSLGGLIDFIAGVFTGDWERAFKGIGEFFEGTFKGFTEFVKTPLNAAIAYIEGFANKVIDAWNWIKGGINSLSIDIPEWLGGGTLGFDLAMSDHISIARFAEGGFPEQGQMFIAREAGAEMVGNIGRRTAVANNDQIVAGIAGGVAEANEEQNVLLREQNSLLRAILEKDSGVYLDGKNLTNSVEKYQRERGRVLITGGVL